MLQRCREIRFRHECRPVLSALLNSYVVESFADLLSPKTPSRIRKVAYGLWVSDWVDYSGWAWHDGNLALYLLFIVFTLFASRWSFLLTWKVPVRTTIRIKVAFPTEFFIKICRFLLERIT